jgi:hypothetical protein
MGILRKGRGVKMVLKSKECTFSTLAQCFDGCEGINWLHCEGFREVLVSGETGFSYTKIIKGTFRGVEVEGSLPMAEVHVGQ